MSHKVDDLMLNASVMMTFMQRGWEDKGEMREWLTANCDKPFDEMLEAIPSKNGRADLTNYGGYNTTSTIKQPPLVPTPSQVTSKHQQAPKKRRRYRHPIATFILYAIFFLLVFLLIKGCGGGSGSGSESGKEGGSLREKEPQVAEITSATSETANYVSEGITIENGHYLINGAKVALEDVVEYLKSLGDNVMVTLSNSDGIIDAYDELVKALEAAGITWEKDSTFDVE